MSLNALGVVNMGSFEDFAYVALNDASMGQEDIARMSKLLILPSETITGSLFRSMAIPKTTLDTAVDWRRRAFFWGSFCCP